MIVHWRASSVDATSDVAVLNRLVHHAHRLTRIDGSLRRLATRDSTDSPAN
jgi:hypothetical protein